MPKKYPTIPSRDVIAILMVLGFSYSHSAGGHDFYKANHSGKNWTVNVDEKCSPFDDFLLKSMIAQSGYSRDVFYGSTKKTAKMAGVKFLK